MLIVYRPSNVEPSDLKYCHIPLRQAFLFGIISVESITKVEIIFLICKKNQIKSNRKYFIFRMCYKLFKNFKENSCPRNEKHLITIGSSFGHCICNRRRTDIVYSRNDLLGIRRRQNRYISTNFLTPHNVLT